jgi:hypothetical protein
MTADDTRTMGEARQHYFDANGFDGTYGERWVKLQAGRFALYLPNAAGRVRAVKLHDLHHVATGYPTTWTGEAQIAAWEIAGGCGGFAWAWMLNLQGLAIGLAIAPRAVFRAFVRGRHSRTLYRGARGLREETLRRSVGAVRRELGLDRPPPPAGPIDGAAFAVWAAAALAFTAAPLLALGWLAARLLA